MRNVPDAIVLCGGAGSRLTPVTGDTPKAMASIAGRPFVELLLRQLSRYGFRRAILAAGPHESVIRQHFGAQAFRLQLTYAHEPAALGTGGAIRNASTLVETDNAIIMNGDSYTQIELSRFVNGYRDSRDDVWIAVVLADGREDCGFTALDRYNNVVGFEEKQHRFRLRYLNAGIYVVSRQLLCEMPCGLPFSWECDVLPRWLAEGHRIRAFICSGRCTDIGTPDRYRSAQQFLANTEVESDTVL